MAKGESYQGLNLKCLPRFTTFALRSTVSNGDYRKKDIHSVVNLFLTTEYVYTHSLRILLDSAALPLGLVRVPPGGTVRK